MGRRAAWEAGSKPPGSYHCRADAGRPGRFSGGRAGLRVLLSLAQAGELSWLAEGQSLWALTLAQAGSTCWAWPGPVASDPELNLQTFG